MRKHNIFIAYRREDSGPIARRLFKRLELHFGRGKVFRDVDTIPKGADFRQHLDQAVAKCDVLIAVIGDRWLDMLQQRFNDPTDYVRFEISTALTRGIPVIPVLVRNAGMPRESALPRRLKRLASRQAAEVRPRQFDADVSDLIVEISRLPVAPKPKPPEIVTKTLRMKFALIPPGTFLMGSPKKEEGRESPFHKGENETQHKVTLSKGFYMGIHQVTVGQFATFVEKSGYKTQAEKERGAHIWTGAKWDPDAATHWRSPGFEQTRDHPVLCLSWNDGVAFANWLAEREKKPIRLPTEAEWEYACRAGTTTPFFFGRTVTTEQANFDGSDTYGTGRKGEYRRTTTEVGTFPPNAFGLCDMHGNAWEWCQDWLGNHPGVAVVDPQGPGAGQRRVLRGGSWRNHPLCCRSAHRNGIEPGCSTYGCGLRVCFCPD